MLNLKDAYGKRFKIETDECKDQQIPCRGGHHIYVHSSTMLAVATNGRKVGIRLAKLPGTVILQEADDGLNVGFVATMFPAVTTMVKPRRRRKMSPSERARLALIGFKKPTVRATSGAPGASEAA